MIIVKIGGGEQINIEGIVSDLSKLKDDIVILHGANELRDQIMNQMGREKRVITSVSGYTSVYSDEELIDMMMMSYSGLKNKRLVEQCQKQGINAIGLSGIDGQLITGKRNRGIRAQVGDKKKIVRDLSGKADQINVELLSLLLNHEYTPVITVPILDQHKVAINSENDDILALLAEELKPDKVVSLIEAPGLMEDIDDSSSRYDVLTVNELKEMESNFGGRIRRKVRASIKLLEQSSTILYLADGRMEKPIENALSGNSTKLTPQ